MTSMLNVSAAWCTSPDIDGYLLEKLPMRCLKLNIGMNWTPECTPGVSVNVSFIGVHPQSLHPGYVSLSV